MWIMILKMTAIMIVYWGLSMLMWKIYHNKKMTIRSKILIGVVFGGLSVLSTHFGADYGFLVINIRDVGPLSAGLFFDPVSGVIAGLIGGIERFIAAEIWGLGYYTQLACSISTILAGFLSMLLYYLVFRKKRPSVLAAFFVGAVMEVFHMYSVFFTHLDDLDTAFMVVQKAAIPMIAFSAITLSLLALLIRVAEGEPFTFFRKRPMYTVPISRIFQWILLIVTFAILLINFFSSFSLQTGAAEQSANNLLSSSSSAIRVNYQELSRLAKSVKDPKEREAMFEVFNSFHVGKTGTFDVVNSSGSWIAGNHERNGLTIEERDALLSAPVLEEFEAVFFEEPSLCWKEELTDGNILLVTLSLSEVYSSRNAQAYQTALSAILLFAILYAVTNILVEQLIVKNLQQINKSLGRITQGNLNEVVDVRNSSEFNYLSDNINTTVDALKGYVKAAEHRMQQDLEFARTIQESALPRNFMIPRKEFSLYATMKAAKVVGGDFYDFFAIGPDRIALVIADVSGKGIPAALFMMRAKTLISNMAKNDMKISDILYHANNTLCENNEAEMFVTVWIGIVNLKTGIMTCSNAGHEYPVLMRAGGDYEIYKDNHGFVLGGMENTKYKEYEVQLMPQDRLFIYTDGVPEAINKETEEYGPDRLCAVLNTVKEASPQETLCAVEEDINRFVGDEDQFDDITMLTFVYNGF